MPTGPTILRRLWPILLVVAVLTVSGPAGVGGLAEALVSPQTIPSAQAAPGDDPSQADTTAGVVIDIDAVTPSTVTTTSPGTVTITGHVRNPGKQTLSNLTVRMQRGQAVTSGTGLRSALGSDASEYPVITAFTPIPGTLGPGGTLPFRVSASLSGDNGLQISQLGVYPLLVAVDGTDPDIGALRLDDSRTLLPVLGLPPDPSRANSDNSWAQTSNDDSAPVSAGPDGAVAPSVSAPTPVTVLWPIAATPTLAAGIPADPDARGRLIDDDLAGSLRGGGRLDTLVSAVDKVTSGTGAATAPLARSLCLAIDPDLLRTVQTMADGYQISENPGDPRSKTRRGTNSSVAADWLTHLRDVAGRMCVVALPYAQTSLDALTRVDRTDLSRSALIDPADTVDQVLGVRSVRDVVIPTTGSLSQNQGRMLGDLFGSTPHGAVISQSAVSVGDISSQGLYEAEGTNVATFDPAVTSAVAQLGDSPTIPAITPSAVRIDPSGESPASRRQTAAASLAYTAIAPSMPAKPDPGPIGRSSLIVPPAVWSPDADDASAVLDEVSTLLDTGLATPRPFGDLAARLAYPTRGTPSAKLIVPAATGLPGTLISQQTVTRVRTLDDQIGSLGASLIQRAGSQLTPEAYLAPLRGDLLRALRPAPQGSAPQARSALTAARTATTTRLAALDASMASMRAAVSIVDPGGQFTLASERSPLLLVVRNELALPIRTRLELSAPSGMQVDDMGVVEIPPKGTRQIQVPARATSSRTVTVHIALVTTSGMAVGDSINLSVHSNAYGKPLFYVTIGAGVLLVLLAGRRLWRRFRGRPDRADADRPEPDEHDRMMAESRYLHSHGRPADGRAGTGRMGTGRVGTGRAPADRTRGDRTGASRSDHDAPGTDTPGTEAQGPGPAPNADRSTATQPSAQRTNRERNTR